MSWRFDTIRCGDYRSVGFQTHMLRLNMKTKTLSWDEWVSLLTQVVDKTRNSYKPDILIPIMNGGLIPAGIVAKQMSVSDVRPVSVGRDGEKRYFIFPSHGKIGNVARRKILIVEDDAMTGKSIELVKEYLFKKRAKEVKTLCVFIAEGVKNIEFFNRELDVDAFPIYPWKKSNFGNRK